MDGRLLRRPDDVADRNQKVSLGAPPTLISSPNFFDSGRSTKLHSNPNVQPGNMGPSGAGPAIGARVSGCSQSDRHCSSSRNWSVCRSESATLAYIAWYICTGRRAGWLLKCDLDTTVRKAAANSSSTSGGARTRARRSPHARPGAAPQPPSVHRPPALPSAMTAPRIPCRTSGRPAPRLRTSILRPAGWGSREVGHPRNGLDAEHGAAGCLELASAIPVRRVSGRRFFDFHGGDFELKGDLVRDKDPAGVKSRIPCETEVLPVNPA